MKYRQLGKTGLNVSQIGFGGIPIIRLDLNSAVNVLKYAFARGINFFDTANAYLDSEMKIGQALKDNRTEIVLATKTAKRDGVGAVKHLENSLRMLQTDYIDLLQLHQVSKEEDWEAIWGPGGAMEGLSKAKEQGKIRHIGITSHSYKLALRAIKTGLFATVMFPFSFIENSASGEMLDLAIEKEIGFLAMKPLAGGVIDNAAIAFKFLRQYPEVIPIPGFDATEYIDEVLAIYAQPNNITPEDLAVMEKYRQSLSPTFCRRCEYCQPCPNGVFITAAIGYPVVVRRMSAPVAVRFLDRAMGSVLNCARCGECLARCPYKLAVPDILQKNYQMYEEHLKLLAEQSKSS